MSVTSVVPLQNQENTQNSGWFRCASCKEEFQKLKNGMCIICFETSEREAELAEDGKKWQVRMFGQRGFDEYHFRTFRRDERNGAAFDALRAFDPARGGIYLWGPVGSGKTHLAVSAAREIPGAEYYKATSLIRWFRLRDPREEEREIARLAALPCLVIDDLGVQKDTEHAIGCLYEVLDSRYMSLRGGLIVTSNLDLDGLAKKIGDDRITSRIAGMCRSVKIDGDDGRIK